MPHSAQQRQLREVCRQLLTEGAVQVVIGYGQGEPDGPVYPLLATSPEEAERLVWNDRCFANLAAYLKRKEVQALGRPAIVVKPCDERALVVLEAESQLARSEVTVIGMACGGVGDPLEPKCRACEGRAPRFADVTLGEAAASPAADPESRYQALDALMQLSPPQRMAYWRAELDRCVKCYACRQVCPLCYCEQCIVDKNRPQVIASSATLKGNYAWHITRAFHLAGRCVGCDECTRACPAGIDLRRLNQSLAKAAEEAFDFRPGLDVAAQPVVGAYRQEDRESFIR